MADLAASGVNPMRLPRDWHAMSTREQWLAVTTFARELCRMETPRLQRELLGELALVVPELAVRLAATLGIPADAELVPREPGLLGRSTRSRPRPPELAPRAT
ncbi:MAG TPA: hypothetical protein VM734_11740 [Kofleriaceae bacterium]|jgi:hypothetical protein|nr:hypothetical protein [Kofleriaceae bacterium]